MKTYTLSCSDCESITTVEIIESPDAEEPIYCPICSNEVDNVEES